MINSKINQHQFIEYANNKLRDMSANERIVYFSRNFNDGLFALTSAGIDAALLLDHIYKLKLDIPVIHINTGFLPVETIQHKQNLVKRYKLKLLEYGPSFEIIKNIELLRLWDGDEQLYSKLSKQDPLANAIRALKVRALITGVRSDQTAQRAKLDIIGYGNNNELRLRPFIDWDKEQVENYFTDNNLPRHPLFFKGFGSVGDYHSTKPGTGRSGRAIMECGIHVSEGKVIANEKLQQNDSP